MPSKIRPIMCYGGNWYQGFGVQSQLNMWMDKCMLPRTEAGTEQEKLIKMFNDLLAARPSHPSSLWIFRESRNTPKNKSRFKLLCEWIGVGRTIPRGGFKKLKGIKVAQGRLRNARTERARATSPAPRNNLGGLSAQGVAGQAVITIPSGFDREIFNRRFEELTSTTQGTAPAPPERPRILQWARDEEQYIEQPPEQF